MSKREKRRYLKLKRGLVKPEKIEYIEDDLLDYCLERSLLCRKPTPTPSLGRRQK